MTSIDVDELSDEEIERVLQTTAFQKAVQYRRLAQGIEVLEEQDAIYNQLVASIVTRHSSVSTRESVEEVLDYLVEEVRTYTEGISLEPDDDGDKPLEEILVEEHEGSDA